MEILGERRRLVGLLNYEWFSPASGKLTSAGPIYKSETPRRLTAIVVPTIVVPTVMVTTVAVAIPVMVVLHAAALAVPVSDEVAPPVVAGSNPSRGRVGHARPITVMPFVVIPDRVPVAIDPNAIGTGTDRTDAQHAGRWWRPYCDSD
jgi:hypothetical protein